MPDELLEFRSGRAAIAQPEIRQTANIGRIEPSHSRIKHSIIVRTDRFESSKCAFGIVPVQLDGRMIFFNTMSGMSGCLPFMRREGSS